ncbi:MAG: type II toxin-antitoxin system HicA family toxin [Candidatus Tectomicrobia bacterium]|uniref:Type II toxin-antitoxin system HicA family toxin n=1 Tax=Tectimicrobiota bacterium TaxID=2528274 RepID=A0A932GNU5_UNCTE|nr:type II toxin-antitoxin system HicA family toxin [Candidatus Tectomicrobia bacterium]
MPKITPTHWSVQEKIFQADGFIFVRQEGSHRAYIKPGIPRPVIIPVYREVPVSIIRNNMKTAGMTRERYFSLLAQV